MYGFARILLLGGAIAADLIIVLDVVSGLAAFVGARGFDVDQPVRGFLVIFAFSLLLRWLISSKFNVRIYTLQGFSLDLTEAKQKDLFFSCSAAIFAFAVLAGFSFTTYNRFHESFNLGSDYPNSEWLHFTTTAGTGGKVYLSKHEKTQSSEQTFYKQLIDYGYRQDTGEFSAISLLEFDCRAKKFREIEIETFSRRGGEGKSFGIMDKDQITSLGISWRPGLGWEQAMVAAVCDPTLSILVNDQ